MDLDFVTLLNTIWIEIDNTHLNFFATFSSVFGLQVAVSIDFLKSVEIVYCVCLILSLVYDQCNKYVLLCTMSTKLQNCLTFTDVIGVARGLRVYGPQTFYHV